MDSRENWHQTELFEGNRYVREEDADKYAVWCLFMGLVSGLGIMLLICLGLGYFVS